VIIRCTAKAETSDCERILFLASPESAFIVGTELVADEGMSQL